MQQQWITRIALQRGQNNGLASLDGNGKIPTTQIPSIFKDTYIVDDIAARDAYKNNNIERKNNIDAQRFLITSDVLHYLFKRTHENDNNLWKFDSMGANKALDMLMKHTGGYEVDNNQKSGINIVVADKQHEKMLKEL